MKFISLLLSLLVANSLYSQQQSDTLSTIEYQILSTSDDQLIINYNDENQKFSGTTGQSGWTYVFKTNKKPFTATLIVNRYPSTKIKRPQVTLKILVNGSVVKTVTGKIGVSSGGQKIQYVIK